MQTVGLADQEVRVEARGDSAERLVQSTLGRALRPSSAEASSWLSLTEDERTLELRGATGLLARGGEGVVGLALVEHALERLLVSGASGLLIHAGAVALGEGALLMPAASMSGKSTLVAALVARGLSYVTDEASHVDADGAVDGFRRAIHLREAVLPLFARLATSDEIGAVRTPTGALVDAGLLGPDPEAPSPRVRALVFPRYSPGAAGTLQPVSAAEAGRRLMEQLVNARNLPGHGFPAVIRLVRAVPAFALEHDDLDRACGTLSGLLA